MYKYKNKISSNLYNLVLHNDVPQFMDHCNKVPSSGSPTSNSSLSSNDGYDTIPYHTYYGTVLHFTVHTQVGHTTTEANAKRETRFKYIRRCGRYYVRTIYRYRVRRRGSKGILLCCPLVYLG